MAENDIPALPTRARKWSPLESEPSAAANVMPAGTDIVIDLFESDSD